MVNLVKRFAGKSVLLKQTYPCLKIDLAAESKSSKNKKQIKRSEDSGLCAN